MLQSLTQPKIMVSPQTDSMYVLPTCQRHNRLQDAVTSDAQREFEMGWITLELLGQNLVERGRLPCISIWTISLELLTDRSQQQWHRSKKPVIYSAASLSYFFFVDVGYGRGRLRISSFCAHCFSAGLIVPLLAIVTA